VNRNLYGFFTTELNLPDPRAWPTWAVCDLDEIKLGFEAGSGRGQNGRTGRVHRQGRHGFSKSRVEGIILLCRDRGAITRLVGNTRGNFQLDHYHFVYNRM